MIYLNPRKHFDDEYGRVGTALAEIQIDNSLHYWDPKDIFLVTNFPYEYHGVAAIEVPDELYCEFEPRNSKGNGVIYLLENKILTEEAWLHDFEAFQNNPFEVKLEKDLGLTDYGWKEKWNTGSLFLKPEALDIFQLLQEGVYKQKAPDEPILWNLYRSNAGNIRARCQKMNITYNLGKRYVETTLPMAEKPIKVVHFHPYWRQDRLERFKKLFLSEKLIKELDEKNPRRKK